MNSPEAAASRAIHSGRRAISEAVVERQYALRPELRDRYGERGREKCIEDTEYHIDHLSAAVLHGLPVWDDQLSLVHLTRDRPAPFAAVRSISLMAQAVVFWAAPAVSS